MKPTSKQNARVGKIRKTSNFKLPNINAMLDRLDNSTPRIMSDYNRKQI